jgi:hypothetical protein
MPARALLANNALPYQRHQPRNQRGRIIVNECTVAAWQPGDKIAVERTSTGEVLVGKTPVLVTRFADLVVILRVPRTNLAWTVSARAFDALFPQPQQQPSAAAERISA